MVRVLFEISLPAKTLEAIEHFLAPDNLPSGIRGRLERVERTVGCETPAQGGDAGWTPCWISVEAAPGDRARLLETLRELKARVVEAAKVGGLEVFAVPASAQIEEAFRRYRDILDIAEDLS